MKSTPKAWRPKMLVLHGEGPALCKKYGGEESGLYSTLTRQDSWEMGPAIDWDDKRRVTSSWGNASGDIKIEDVDEWGAQSEWKSHPVPHRGS
jgi:hypothetical protein